MGRPHEWTELWPNLYPAIGTRRCVRCSVLSWMAEALAPCPVVTPSDAFAALEFVLGQAWRTYAWSDLVHGKPVYVADRLVEIRRSMAATWLLRTRALAEVHWEHLRNCAIEDDARAAALDLIERLGS